MSAERRCQAQDEAQWSRSERIALWLLAIPAAAIVGPLWLAVIARLAGCTYGLPASFGRALAPRPAVPPPPPDPSLNRWRPWFRLWGPVWLDLKHGLPTDPTFWRGYQHERTAYRLYGEDDLPGAEAVLQEALACGTRPGMWSATMLNLTVAELTAREEARRLDRPPFVFELPAEEGEWEGLVDVAQRCAICVEQTLGFGPESTMVTLLTEATLPRTVGSRWGYLALKERYAKICLLHPPSAGLAEAETGLVHEYVRLAVHRLTEGKAPSWVVQGLVERTAREVLGGAPTTGSAGPVEHQSPPLPRRLLARWLGFSPLELLTATGVGAGEVVDRLLREHGEGAMRSFLTELGGQTKTRAFAAAFGTPETRFAASLVQ